ncbi:hypothetical protein DM02DRAFT_524999 [Periconia macrospinosa]|uniref:F-box domain-containing protein n=1 Tax=Periconia macrospinosa TaxID=97972 RepID=A0A2V1DVV5_9PLEO|nr:hypothetical protein DM02DRAFT_524999 [Periconia macrospinosa]
MLSRMPLELLRAISDHLDIQDKAHLAMVNRHLRISISPTLEDFIQAETSEWAASKQLYTCKRCMSFRKDVMFADAMRKGRDYARGGSMASLRLCIQCGLKVNFYTEGMTIVYLGGRAILGRPCSSTVQLTDYSTRKTICGSIVPAQLSVHRTTQSYWDRRHLVNGDGWSHPNSVYIDRNIDEMDAYWFDI